MTWFIAGLGLLLLVWLAMRAFAAASPANVVQGIRWAGLGVGGTLAIYMLVTGRGGAVIALTAGLLPLLMRWRRARPPPSGANTSEVETDYLRMTLDHDTGRMEGIVRKGAYQGRRLAELAREEVLALLREIRAEDQASASLLETWLDRAWPDWRSSAAGDRRPSRMTEEEALEVLDLAPGASEEEIRAAHRRLMLKVHPDQGGSTWLAARLNEARDVLLGGRR